MPLHDDATDRIREQLHRIACGERVPIIKIGYLTYQQIKHINDERAKIGLWPIDSAAHILYIGGHHYASRSKQGYTIDDMILQIHAATSADCDIVIGRKMTVMRSPLLRPDGYGNKVRDEAVFELMKRKPHVELYSVIPKGDTISPLMKQQSP